MAIFHLRSVEALCSNIQSSFPCRLTIGKQRLMYCTLTFKSRQSRVQAEAVGLYGTFSYAMQRLLPSYVLAFCLCDQSAAALSCVRETAV